LNLFIVDIGDYQFISLLKIRKKLQKLEAISLFSSNK
jgi:hypothetical protein